MNSPSWRGGLKKRKIQYGHWPTSKKNWHISAYLIGTSQCAYLLIKDIKLLKQVNSKQKGKEATDRLFSLDEWLAFKLSDPRNTLIWIRWIANNMTDSSWFWNVCSPQCWVSRAWNRTFCQGLRRHAARKSADLAGRKSSNSWKITKYPFSQIQEINIRHFFFGS